MNHPGGKAQELTRDHFERQYASFTRISVETLRSLGYFPIPCHCGEGGCEGWQMTTDKREPGPWEGKDVVAAWRTERRKRVKQPEANG